MLIRPKKWNIANLKNIKKFESIYKNGKKLKLGDIEIKKRNFTNIKDLFQ